MREDSNIYSEPSDTICLKLGRHIIKQLRDLATKESIRREDKVTTTLLMKEALLKTYPSILD